MQIDPQNEWYGEIDSLRETEEVHKAFEQAVKDGKIVAVSHDKQQLLKLQESLRQAGYRRQ